MKGFLIEAETELAKGEYQASVIKSTMAFDWTLDKVRDSIIGRLPDSINGFLVTNSSRIPQNSREVLDVFKRLRDLAFQSAIGLDFNYFQYKRTIQPIARIFFAADGSHEVITNKIPTPQEAKFAVEFVINAVIEIENLVGDIDKPFEL